jgi:hypothetical protein
VRILWHVKFAFLALAALVTGRAAIMAQFKLFLTKTGRRLK